MAEPQLKLLEAPVEWRLDEHTKEVGRRGVAQARAALQAAILRRAEQARPGDDPHDDHRDAA